MKLTPSTPDDLAQALAEAAGAKQTIALAGASTKCRFGGPIEAAAVSVSTTALNRILEYEPHDLTVSVEAGVKWADFQAVLAANRQMVPLDPPYNEGATVGGVLAANSSGPRRRLFGSVRDVVIGMKFATLEGKLVQSGGMVVKNVAGLDMGKLLIGSFGTLGAIAVANFKISPMPPVSKTFLFQFASSTEAFAKRNDLLASVLQPTAIDLVNPAGAKRLGRDGWLLAVQAGGSEKLIDRYRRELPGSLVLDGASEQGFWETVREFVPRYLAEQPSGYVVRVSTALQEMETAISGVQAPVLCRAGNGITYVCGEMPKAGRWVVETNPSGGEQWPTPGAELDTMKKIKQLFDPSGLLNRGRMYGRL